MPPKSFHRFKKLPVEIRLRIWNLMIEPRLIHAHWESEALPKNEAILLSLYTLRAGIVPRVLQICRESREEAKRKYSMVKSRLPTNGDPNQYRFSKYLIKDFWIDFEVDTIYFVNLPSTTDFLTYRRRLCKERISGGQSSIKQIAFSSIKLLEFRARGQDVYNWKLQFLYRLALSHTELRNIIILLDGSKFAGDQKKPQEYSLSNPVPLDPAKSNGGKRNIARENLKDFEKFFTYPAFDGTGPAPDLDSFKEMRQRKPDWIVPTFRILSITKSSNVGYASDGLPALDFVKKKKRTTPKPKICQEARQPQRQPPLLPKLPRSDTDQPAQPSSRSATPSSGSSDLKTGRKQPASAKASAGAGATPS